MGRGNWIEATKLAQAKKDAQKNPCDKPGALEAAAAKLTDWLNGPNGLDARAMLSAASRFVRLSETEPEGGYTQVYYLDGTGLHESVETSGMCWAYSKNVPDARITDISPLDAIRGIWLICQKKMPIEQIVQKLESDLDTIAENIKAGNK